MDFVELPTVLLRCNVSVGDKMLFWIVWSVSNCIAVGIGFAGSVVAFVFIVLLLLIHQDRIGPEGTELLFCFHSRSLDKLNPRARVRVSN